MQGADVAAHASTCLVWGPQVLRLQEQRTQLATQHIDYPLPAAQCCFLPCHDAETCKQDTRAFNMRRWSQVIPHLF